MNLNSPLDPRHHARYDNNGDIVLPGASSQSHGEPVEAWEIVEETVETDDGANITRMVHTHVAELSRGVRGALQEGVHQYKVSVRQIPSALDQLGHDTRSVLQKLRDFLTQPVDSPQHARMQRPLNRTTLFIIDVLRFGGTFTGIFVVLFVALNYQSFWQISTSAINPLLSGPSVSAPPLDDGSHATAGQNDFHGNLIEALPPVGPPQDRLIIPKLKVNVPLVTPPTDALLDQNWDQVEKDIQSALQRGVVHYPGTARAGQAGNFFITGHSSYYPWDPGKYKTVFARLHDLEVGDEYSVYVNGDLHRYRITQVKEVKPSDTSVLDQPSDKRISTLMTCTPLGTALRRLILVAQEVHPTTGEVMEPGEHAAERPIAAPLPALPI